MKSRDSVPVVMIDPVVKMPGKSEDDHVTIVGKVLRKVSPLELPADDDIPLLEEVKAQEVREFKKKYGLL